MNWKKRLIIQPNPIIQPNNQPDIQLNNSQLNNSQINNIHLHIDPHRQEQLGEDIILKILIFNQIYDTIF